MDKKMNEREMLNYLTGYLMGALLEIKNVEDCSGISEGELLAYVEIFEILGNWSDFDECLMLNIEKYLNIA